jgi:hypothetical protein
MPRDLNGNYTLPAGNPVASGTLIETAWANPTMSDVATAITDSLSRSGNGGMLVSFKNADGTLGAPGISWTNEPTSGWWRSALNSFWYSVGAENVFRITKTGVELATGKNFVNFNANPLNINAPLASQAALLFSASGVANWNLYRPASENNLALFSVGLGADVAKFDYLTGLATFYQSIVIGENIAGARALIINTAASAAGIVRFQNAGVTQSEIFRPAGSNDLHFTVAAFPSNPLLRLDQSGNVFVGAKTGGTLVITSAALNANAAAINEAYTSRIGTAPTLPLAANDGNVVDITGDNQAYTTADSAPVGTTRRVRFNATGCTLLNNNSSLFLPCAVGEVIHVQTGDCATFQSFGGTIWLCTSYQPASGQPVRSGAPQVLAASTYTTVIGDAGKHIMNQAPGVGFILAANSSVPYVIGTIISFINSQTGPVTLSSTDSLFLAGSGTGAEGLKTLAGFAVATAIKTSPGAWIVSGAGVT